jgi:bacterial/archaeal transporter family protein
MDPARYSWLLLAVLSAFFAALTTILAKIGIRDVPSNLGTAIRTVVILLLAWGIVMATGEVNGLRSVSQKAWIFLILSGVATGLSWICYFAALQKGPASVVSPIDKTSVAMVLVLAAIFLGEPLTLKNALGGALVVIGAIVIALK